MSPEVLGAWLRVPFSYRGPVRCSHCLFTAYFLGLYRENVYEVSIHHLDFLFPGAQMEYISIHSVVRKSHPNWANP